MPTAWEDCDIISVLKSSSSWKPNMTTIVDETSVQTVGNILIDKTQPLKDRFRALFTLRNIGGEKAIDFISNCFDDTSALLKHELAYCLGQMQDKYALKTLSRVLADRSQEAMVRHEAGKYRCICIKLFLTFFSVLYIFVILKHHYPTRNWESFYSRIITENVFLSLFEIQNLF